MFYKKSNQGIIDKNLFKNPSCEYRSAPFWAWNGKLDKEILKKQIFAFKKMGYGGFFMHVRFGLQDEYMDENFNSAIKHSIKVSEEQSLHANLYDEDRWPSGFGGGKVTENPLYRNKNMYFLKELPDNYIVLKNDNKSYSCELPVLCARYAVKQNNTKMLSYRRLLQDEHASAGEIEYFAVLKNQDKSPWYNGFTYVDACNKDAIKAFIKCTHEKYKKNLSKYFGNVVSFIFSDEPNIRPLSYNSVHWSENFFCTFQNIYNENIFNRLPELFFDGDFEPDYIYRFYEMVSEQFALSYSDQIGEWCEKNNINFTGHYLCEDTIEGQKFCSADVMRQYRSYHFPGMDLLCDCREYITALQVKSVVNQYGKEGAMCELFGSTNWDFDFRNFKLQGDWLASMGITFRVPHLAWYTMKGEGKRDYPASLGIQSNWCNKFSVIEDHAARVNVCLTGGKEVVSIGVIHPIESSWVSSNERNKALTEHINNLSEILVKNGISFDFLNESILKNLCKKGSNPLNVGKGSYDVIVIPTVITMRKNTIELLLSFVENGGKIIAISGCPEYVEGKKSSMCQDLWNKCINVNSISDLINYLKPYIFVDFTRLDVDNWKNHMGLDDNEKRLISRTVKKGNDYFLFFSRCDKDKGSKYISYRIMINGVFNVEEFNTLNGKIKNIPCKHEDGKTIIDHDFYSQDSLMLRAFKTEKIIESKDFEKVYEFQVIEDIKQPELIYTDEKNVLLLDRGYAICNGRNFSEKEILQLDEEIRAYNKMEPRDFCAVQPYKIKECNRHMLNVDVRYTFNSGINYKNAVVAVEDGIESIKFNNRDVKLKPCGHYVDDSIICYQLPEIRKGENLVDVKYLIDENTGIENIYILGDFFVEKSGFKGRIVVPRDEFFWENISDQGFAFYGGNIYYQFNFNCEKEDKYYLKLDHFNGNLTEVMVDNEKCDDIVFAPYRTCLGRLKVGEHKVLLKFYGNRFNTFGQLHNATPVVWDGSYAWRTKGDEWSENLLTRSIGILGSVKIECLKNNKNVRFVKRFL